jgi:alpha-mannosidase
VLGDAIDTESFISVDTPSIVLDTIKRAEDGEGLIVRFYEAEGRRGTATLRFAQAPTTVTRTNILEDPGAAVTVDGQTVSVPFGPFQVITLRCV